MMIAAHASHLPWPDFETHAAQCCSVEGRELTPLRREVLRELWSAKSPISVPALTKRLNGGARGVRVPNMSVHRTLALFHEIGLLQRVESRNAYVPVPPGLAGPLLILLCNRCTSYSLIPAGIVAGWLQRIAAGKGIAPARLVLEMLGTCPACRTTHE